jgi:methylated-DNA-[protein]-cysteine S-methyltransferase
MTLYVETMDTPIGTIFLVARGEVLVALIFAESWDKESAALQRRFAAAPLVTGQVPAAMRRAVEAYFAGDPAALDSIAVDPGGTPFQKRVWAALQQIPAGTTVSYSDLAAAIGQPQAVRAVGMANGRNPIAIVIPCHRVIGADGKLRGYGGGVARKRWLLDHESALSPLFAGVTGVAGMTETNDPIRTSGAANRDQSGRPGQGQFALGQAGQAGQGQFNRRCRSRRYNSRLSRA